MSPSLLCCSLRRAGLPASLARCWPGDRAQRAALLAATRGAARERLVLATCARLELYLVDPRVPDDAAAGVLAGLLGAPAGALAEWSATFRGNAAVEHLLRVAAGLESRVLGEPQILQQVRLARQEAHAQQAAGPLLTALGGAAVHAGKRVRRETALGAGRASAATLAVDRLEVAWGTLRQRVVAVVGSGHMARDVVQELARRRTGEVVVVSGDAGRAGRIVRDTGRGTRHVTRLGDVLAAADGLVACTATRDYVLRPEDLHGASALHLVDLGTPSNIDPAVAQRAGVTLTLLDDLPVSSPPPQAVADAEGIVRQLRDRFEVWLAGRDLAGAINRLRLSYPRDPAGRRRAHEEITRLKLAARVPDRVPSAREAEREVAG